MAGAETQAGTGDDASVDETDGLRLGWPDRWLHVRASNTEPVVRVIAESPGEASTTALLDAAESLARSA